MQVKFRDINNYTYEYEDYNSKRYEDILNTMQVYLIVDKIKEVEIE